MFLQGYSHGPICSQWIKLGTSDYAVGQSHTLHCSVYGHRSVALTSPHKGWYTSLTVKSVMSYSSIETGFSLLFIALAATKADGFALYFLGECNNVSIYI